jgi:plastocyanin
MDMLKWLPQAAVRIAAFCVLATLSCPSAVWSADDQKVTIDNFAFSPSSLTVSAGSEVTWTNQDDIPHSIVLPGVAHSKPLDSNDTFSYRFDKSGTYSYICGLHPHMHGEIVVR